MRLAVNAIKKKMEYGEVMDQYLTANKDLSSNDILQSMDQNPTANKDLSSNDILRSKGLLNEEQNVLDITKLDEIKEWKEKVVEEQEKWDALVAVQQTDVEPKLLDINISYEEAFDDLKTLELQDSIQTHMRRSRFVRFLHWLFGPKPLLDSLLAKQQLIFNITQITIDNDNLSHCRVLQTIYRKLTKTIHNQPRFGSHWEEIGFQGNDPATDLRGTGFLSLLQMLFLVSKHLPVATEMYKLSVDPIYNFPFSLVSINITRIALQALREEKLSRICNKRNEVIEVFNDFYLATFWHFYSVWKEEHKTMIDSGNVIKNLEKYAIQNAPALIKSMPVIDQQCQPSPQQHAAPPIAFSRLSTGSTISESSLNQSEDTIIQPKVQHMHEISTDTFEGVIELSAIHLPE